jgi:hypothetical protein
MLIRWLRIFRAGKIFNFAVTLSFLIFKIENENFKILNPLADD